jgi:predicted N-formylglutamate amidohydrolase
MQPSRETAQPSLLSAADPAPVAVVNPGGRAPLVLVCEHAGRAAPVALDGLGLGAEAMAAHVAWDIGAEGVARRMAEALDAPLVLQRYSRLVVDCNRPAHAADCMPEVSDGVVVPANRALGPAERAARWDEIHAPFHREVALRLDATLARGPAALVAIHSFTPALATRGVPRPWYVGLLARRDRRLATALMAELRAEDPGLPSAFDEPYQITDLGDYTIPVHGEARGIPHVLIEVRNDLIAGPEGQDAWGDRLARALAAALPSVLEKAP